MRIQENENSRLWTLDLKTSTICVRVYYSKIAYYAISFNDFDARLIAGLTEPDSSRIGLWVNVESLETGNDDLNKRLKSAETFDVSKYKLITFSSTRILDTENGKAISGHLTVADKSHDVQFAAQAFEGNQLNSEVDLFGLSLEQEMSVDDLKLSTDSLRLLGSPVRPDRIVISCVLEFQCPKLEPNENFLLNF